MIFNLFKNKEKALEKAKQKLILELQNNGIKYLLEKLNCDEPYSPIIIERNQNGSYSTHDSVSWYAFIQSTKLNSEKDKLELLELVNDPKYLNQKTHIYQCLSSICKNTNDNELFNKLMHVILNEEDETILVSILSRLQDFKKEPNLNIAPIIKHLQEGTNMVRLAAIRALSFTNDPEVEDILLTEFKISDTHTKGIICGPLSSVGTVKSISILQSAYKKTREPYLRSSIESTIKEIESRK